VGGDFSNAHRCGRLSRRPGGAVPGAYQAGRRVGLKPAWAKGCCLREPALERLSSLLHPAFSAGPLSGPPSAPRQVVGGPVRAKGAPDSCPGEAKQVRLGPRAVGPGTLARATTASDLILNLWIQNLLALQDLGLKIHQTMNSDK